MDRFGQGVKQAKAKNVARGRTETLTFRLDRRLRALAEIAARLKGVKLASYVEEALRASLEGPVELLGGASIASLGDALFDEDEAQCFVKRLRAPWALSPEQVRLRDLVHTSRVLYPGWGTYNTALIAQSWSELRAIAEGRDDARALPEEVFEGVDVEFALMSEAERIALYQRSPAECARRTEAYLRLTKREVPEAMLQAMEAQGLVAAASGGRS